MAYQWRMANFVQGQQKLDFNFFLYPSWLCCLILNGLLLTHWCSYMWKRAVRIEEYVFLASKAILVLQAWYQFYLYFSWSLFSKREITRRSHDDAKNVEKSVFSHLLSFYRSMMPMSAKRRGAIANSSSAKRGGKVLPTTNVIVPGTARQRASIVINISAVANTVDDKHHHRHKHGYDSPVPAVDLEVGLKLEDSFCNLSLDIFVPCYQEPLEIVRETVNAALEVHVPEEITTLSVYVCDDGRDAAKRLWFSRYQTRYDGKVTRRCVYLEHGHHGQMKGGNLNCGLRASHGQLISTLDADMVPLPDSICILFRALKAATRRKGPRPYAFVQSPQRYHDVPGGDPFASRTLEWYERLLPISGSFEHGSAPFVGTGGMFWRHALEGVGGFNVGQVTEDVQTASEVHMAGCNSVLMPIVTGAAVGESPQTGLAFFRQRTRWAWGSYTLWIAKCPLIRSGYSMYQRAYWSFTVFSYWIQAVQKVLEWLAIGWLILRAINGTVARSKFFFFEDGWLLLVLSWYLERVCWFTCPSLRSTWIMVTDWISSRWMDQSMALVYLYMLKCLVKVVANGERYDSMEFAMPSAATKTAKGSKDADFWFYCTLITIPGSINLSLGIAGLAYSGFVLQPGRTQTMTITLSLMLANYGIRNLWFLKACCMPIEDIPGEHSYIDVSHPKYYWFRMLVDFGELFGLPLLWLVRHGPTGGLAIVRPILLPFSQALAGTTVGNIIQQCISMDVE